MTIGACIYEPTTLKTKFASSVNAQILGSHKSTKLHALCLHGSHEFFFIVCFLFSFAHVLSASEF